MSLDNSEGAPTAGSASPADPPPSGRFAAVVYNAIKVDLDAIRGTVADEAAQAGWKETLWFETSKDDSGRGATNRALDAGVSMIIVAGGDGTIRTVAERSAPMTWHSRCSRQEQGTSSPATSSSPSTIFTTQYIPRSRVMIGRSIWA